MTLRSKTLLISALAMLILAGGFYVVAVLIQSQGNAQIERSQVRGGVARVWQALVRETDDLQSIMRNYTGTGDPLGLTIESNRQYLNYTFSDDVLRNMRVDLVLLLTASGEIAFAKRRLSQTTGNTPGESLDEFARMVFAHSLAGPDFTGYFPLAEHLIMFAAQPVLPLNGAEALKGTLIFGREMNDASLLRLNQTTQLIIQIRLLPGTQKSGAGSIHQSLPQDFRDAQQALSDAKENLVTVNVSDAITASYAMITNISNVPVAMLRMEAARTSHELGIASTRYLLWALLAAGLVLAAANVGIVDRLVLTRLTLLSRDVNNIAQNREFDVRVGIFGNDELTGLAMRINELLTALHSQHELEQALAAAQDATRAKSLFLANMSHELRTPLNAIIGYSELLADDAIARGTTDQSRDLKRILDAGHHLRNIVSDVLDLAKIEAGKLELNYAPFNLRHALNMVHDVIQLRAREKNLALAFDVPADIPEKFIGDVVLLRQILLNLLNNAVKYTERGRVELALSANRLPGFPAAHAEGEYFEIQFAVRDTGQGIPANQLDSLFKPFNRVESAANRRLGGAGLGLALSKQLTELMGGRIWAQSHQNQGSIFFFTIIAEAMPQGAQLYNQV